MPQHYLFRFFKCLCLFSPLLVDIWLVKFFQLEAVLYSRYPQSCLCFYILYVTSICLFPTSPCVFTCNMNAFTRYLLGWCIKKTVCADIQTVGSPVWVPSSFCLLSPLLLPQDPHKMVFPSGVPDASAGDCGQPEAVPGGLIKKVLWGEEKCSEVSGFLRTASLTTQRGSLI